MSTLVKIWDLKGEPFEVRSNKVAGLLAQGWTTSEPAPAVTKELPLFEDAAKVTKKHRASKVSEDE
ncbi:hypothetical protein [Sinorhizobium meliloti]|uniref:hypothetical protein n=1 Tax=Rhizobium meliloti TaxID=382 RepID=UPI001297D373|nr:hypothetical protein [Sinorhizobium meliloti]MDW9491684.1 hypothetical protein [Sinorhizobium meliloti]MDW9531887.1 hypothetical protein [Sinorhizobium meliloti]MQV02950.1 hypothetical protein [Sinorhizobium meliloti]